jgi:hypothetical protein
MGVNRNAYRILVGKPERKSPLGSPRRRWGDNIKMDVREREWGFVWTGLIWSRIVTSGGRALVNEAMNLRVPQYIGNFLSSCITGGSSRMAHLHGDILVG